MGDSGMEDGKRIEDKEMERMDIKNLDQRKARER